MRKINTYSHWHGSDLRPRRCVCVCVQPCTDPCDGGVLLRALLLVAGLGLLVLLAELKVLLFLQRPGQLLRLGLGHRQVQLG